MNQTTHTARLARTLCTLACSLWLGACGHTPRPAPGTPQPTDAQALAPSAPTEQPATTPDPSLLSGQWAGRLSLKLGAWQGQSASGITLAFDLNSQAQQGVLDLSTALGTQVARLRWRLDGALTTAELDTADGSSRFDSLETLSQAVLGEALPLQALSHWLSGQPAPWLPHTPGLPPGQFEQAGWRVDASELPRGRLNLERPASDTQRGVTLRVRLDL